MKKVKKIAKTIICIVVGLITLFNIYNLVNTQVLKNDLTTVNSYAVLEVVSGSMNPNIKVGDLIFIDTNYETVNVGDIITYKDENNAFVTHRVIMKEDTTILTKGDANNTIDKPIKINNIVGKYSFKVPYIGNILNSLRNPFTLIVILIFGTSICVLLSMDIDDNEEVSVVIKPKKTQSKKEEKRATTKKKTTKKSTKKNK